MAFQVIPAIDIQGGKAVRLRQGRQEDSTVFDDSPVEVARRFAAEGATRIHVVDLDGAFRGRPVNEEIIHRIVNTAGCPVQVGGGVRNYAIAARYLGAGISRIILGTSIVRNPEEVLRITKAYTPGTGSSPFADGWRSRGSPPSISRGRWRRTGSPVSSIRTSPGTA